MGAAAEAEGGGEEVQEKKGERGEKGGRKKPDMQIYRPGMGRFSSKSQKKTEENEEGAGAGINEGDTEESREGSPSKKAGGERGGGRRRQEQEVQQGEEEPKAGKSYRGARVRRKKGEEDAAGRVGEGAVKGQEKGD